MNAAPVVIVAGDSSDSRGLIANMLVAEPCHIVEARDGATVLDLVGRHTGDLVLIETYMDDLDGLEVCRRLRKEGENNLLPIVMISAMDDIASRVAAINAGADDFLSKPIERNELIARVRSLLKMKSMRDRLEDARQVIFALANAAEAKDLFTVEHTARVADSASALARRLGLPSDVIEQIRVGGLIHDVGKLAVPDGVLNKPAALTAAEFALIKSHTLVGAEIVAPLASQRHVISIVRSHHERFDGAGYPDGLAGEEIPVGARIVAVCDSYDAMVNQRPYRKAMSHDAAVERLLAGRGTQWDGRIVDALVGMYSGVVNLSNESVRRDSQPIR
jgi:cyclic di-GMP phosphodiesterase